MIKTQQPVRKLANHFTEALQLCLNLFQPKPEIEILEVDIQEDRVLIEIWCELSNQFFPEHKYLTEYRVRWSGRKQRRVLASCNLDKKIVTVASALKHPDYRQLLPPLIYHEMCHAVVGISRSPSRRRVIHGGAFRALERRHPEIETLDNWIKNGGWTRAVRRYSAQIAWQRRNGKRGES